MEASKKEAVRRRRDGSDVSLRTGGRRGSGDKIPKAIPRQKRSYALQKKPESVLVQVMLWVVESRVLVHCIS